MSITNVIMSCGKQTILSAFNDHFDEFMNDVVILFPDNLDIRSSKSSIQLLRKVNPRMLIGIWNTYISSKYAAQIEAGDIRFFIDNDYTEDVGNMSNSSQIISAIDKLRDPVKQMDSENRDKTMKYIQNLKKLCDLYLS